MGRRSVFSQIFNPVQAQYGIGGVDSTKNRVIGGAKDIGKKFNNSGAGFLTTTGLYQQAVEKPAMMRREGGQLANQERAIADTQIKAVNDQVTTARNERASVARRALTRRQTSYNGGARPTILGGSGGGRTLLGG
jgi:hypothetical protein